MTSGLSETGDRVNVLEPQEQWKTEEAGEASTLLGIMLTREELLHIHHEVNMKKQKNISLKVDESTLAKDFADFIDENNANNSNTMEKIDSNQLIRLNRTTKNSLQLIVQWAGQLGRYICRIILRTLWKEVPNSW